jgi:hypothetical protein
VAALEKETAIIPNLAQELAAFRSDAEGYFKSSDDASPAKKGRKDVKSSATKSPGPSSLSVEAAARAAASPNGQLLQAYYRRPTDQAEDGETGAAAGAEWASVMGEEPPASVTARSERSDHSGHSGATPQPPTGESEAGTLTREALARHEAEENGRRSPPEALKSDGPRPSGSAEPSSPSPSPAVSQKELRSMAQKMLIFEEFLKELAALALEHCLLSVNQACVVDEEEPRSHE